MPSHNRTKASLSRQATNSQNSILESGDPKKLATRSSDLQQSRGAIAKLSFSLLQSRDERQARREIADEMTETAEKLLTAKLSRDAELLQAAQEIRARRQTTLQLVAHRQVMHSLGERSEDDLNEQCTGLFADKKRLLERLATIDGDDDLKAFAAQYLSQITLASADELLARNRRPR